MSSNSSFEVFQGGWEEIQNAVFTDNEITFSAPSPTSFFIKPDGTQLFVLKSGLVESRPLSVPWDIATAGSVTDSFDVTTVDSSPFGIFFQDDGTHLFVLGTQGTPQILQYVLSTPWNVSTATFQKAAPLTGVIDASSIFFSRDGDFLYITDVFDNTVYRFEVNTPWEVDTLGTLTSFAVPGALSLQGVSLKPEGDLMFIGDFGINIVKEFILSPPFSLSSPTSGGSFDFISVNDIFFRGNGKQFFIADTGAGTITKLEMDKEWDISTASFFNNSFPVIGNLPRDVFWRPDGLKMFELDSDQAIITEYDATTPFNTNTLTQVGTFDVSDEQLTAQGFWWSTDGLEFFIVGLVKTVFQYTTTTPYSFSGMGLDPTDSFDFIPGGGGATGVPTGIFFNPDGTIMLVSFDNPEFIRQWDLSNSFELPPDLTAQNKALSIPGGDAIDPRGLFLKPDGLRMYLPSNTNDDVGIYALTTPFGSPILNPFDIETAVLVDKLDVGAAIGNPQGISLSNDGKQLFICDQFLQIISTCVVE